MRTGEGEVPLICLQHYQSAEPAGAEERCGVVGLCVGGVWGGGISARVCAQIHTPGLHGSSVECEAQPVSAHSRY